MQRRTHIPRNLRLISKQSLIKIHLFFLEPFWEVIRYITLSIKYAIQSQVSFQKAKIYDLSIYRRRRHSLLENGLFFPP